MSQPGIRLSDEVIVLLARIEQAYGCARVVMAAERTAVIRRLGAHNTSIVIDAGDGRVVTYRPRGGDLQVHHPD